jgi:tetratricopeptide (TPR) repeat protein
LQSFSRALAIRQRVADANPAVTAFQADLAQSLHYFGYMQSDTGHPEEALRSYTRALEIHQRLADANPTVTHFQARVADSHRDIGVLQSKTGHPDNAMQSYTRALAMLRKLADANPTVTGFQEDLALHYGSLGALQRTTGHPVEALRSLESGLVILEKLDGRRTTHLYNRACLLALISALAGPDGQGADAGDRAMLMLRRAIAAGYRDVGHIARDTDLDALRSRPDFQLLMWDLAFPSDPFVGPR